MREKNLFFNLSSDNEDTVTELLVNLMRPRHMMYWILKALGFNEGDIQTIEFEDIETQISIVDQKRPDIVIRKDEVLWFVENKIHIDTTLQESQITQYPLELIQSKKRKARLVFIIPKSYKHKVEIDNAINKYSSVSIGYIFWEDFIDQLLKMDLAKTDSLFDESIRYIMSVLEINSPKFGFSKEEIVLMNHPKDLEVACRSILKMKTCLDSVGKTLLEKYPEKILTSWWKHDDTYVGLFLGFGNDDGKSIFIGFDFLMNDDYAFSISVKREFIDEQQLIDLRFTTRDGWYYFNFDKYLLAEEDKLIEKILVRFAEVYKAIL